MKAITSLLFIIVAFAALIIFSSSAYTVDQTELAIVTEFGKPVGEPINVKTNEAGLHFKKPFVQAVNRFEKRIMEWDGPDSEMPTRDKLYIMVDSFARWRIADPLKYFQSLTDERRALSRLDDIIGSEIRNEIAKRDLIEVVRTDKTRKPVFDETLLQVNPVLGVLPTIQFGREQLEKEILAKAAPKAKELGIELLDVRFKRINYKPGVIEKIYDRMTSERLQIAERFRSEGAGEAAKILGRKEKDLRQIESDAYKKIQEIQGKADAQATQIYAQAYNTSPEAADFYQFLKTLESYKVMLGRDSTLVLTTESDLFKYLKHIKPALKNEASAVPK